MGKLTSKLDLRNISWKSVVTFIIVLILGLITGSGIGLSLSPEGEMTVETDYAIELADEQREATIEATDGTIEVIAAPTVESIDGAQLAEECGEDEECGRGWYVDTSTPQAFQAGIINQCIDTDGHFGSQCWDAGNLFWQNYAGRALSTCGTGAAKGTIADGCYQKNAGDEFEMVWDANALQPGDWVVFTNGQYGHIGMALGYSNNGYIALLGTNQGGSPCSGGGSTANIINISLANFGGAFRPKSYIKAEPEPEPEPEVVPVSGCVQWHVERGDTMSKIMLECENTVVYGSAMDAYAKTWYSLVYVPGQSVYDGWHSSSGVGLYAGDDIEHRVE